MNKTARCLSRAAAATYAALLLMLCLASVAKGDNCSGPDDCRAAPGNIDAATGVAGGGAGIAIAWWTYRRRKEHECAQLRQQCEASRTAADDAEKAAKEARSKADEANKPCAEARKAREAAEKELADLDDSYLDKSWAESEGRRITRRDLKLKRDAAKEAHQRYRRGEITAQQLEQEWKRLDTPEALEELRKKDGETREERKATAEKRLADAKEREQEACKAADPALEAQAEEAGRKAREAREKAQADCRAAAECAKALTVPPPPEPEPPKPPPPPQPPEKEPEPQPEEERCAVYRETLARKHGTLDALYVELNWANHALDYAQYAYNLALGEHERLGRIADEARRKLEEFGLLSSLWSSLLHLYGVEGAAHAATKAYKKAVDAYVDAGNVMSAASDRLSDARQTAARLDSSIWAAERERKQAQDRLARCLAGLPVDAEPEAVEPTGNTTTTTTDQEPGDDYAPTKIFGPRRGE